MSSDLYEMTLKHFNEAHEESGKNIEKSYKETIEKLFWFSEDVFSECHPSDFENVFKASSFPANEAPEELKYSIFLAKGGLYKHAYIALRNFLELSLVCFYFLILEKYEGKKWLRGEENTPFKRRILRVLFNNKKFIEIDKIVNLKEKIDDNYNYLSNFCHTKGRPFSHQDLNRANYPNFIDSSFKQYIEKVLDICDIVITCFVSINPIILFPLPIEQKFGLNGPMSGFLEENQVEVLFFLLKEESQRHLFDIYENSDEITSIIQGINSMPDLSDKELHEQVKQFKKDLDLISHPTK
jgi:hypothetical protein